MISAPKTKLIKTASHRHGFSLIELMISLALIAIITGASMLYIGTKNSSELSELRTDMINLVRDARARAVDRSQAQYLNATGRELWVDTNFESATDAENRSNISLRLMIPEGVDTYIKEEGASAWTRLAGADQARWCISSSGLSEPVSIKFEEAGQGAVEEVEFHPFFSSPEEFLTTEQAP